MIFKNTLSAQVKGQAIALLLIFTVFGTKAQERITLQQAVELTLQNNLQIKQSKLSEALSQESLKESKLFFYPTLNAGANLNFNFGQNVDPLTYEYVNQQTTSSNGSITAGLPIFQGFRLWHQVSQYKYQLEADKSNTKKIQNDLALTVVTTYLQVLSNQDLLTAAEQQLELARLQLDREQKQFDVGSKTLADLSQAKAQAATAELNVTNAKNQVDISYLNLAQLMERDPGNRFEVVKPVVNQLGDINNEKAAEIYGKAVENYPDISLAKYRTLTAQKAVDVARSALYPRLTFQGNIGSGYSSNRTRVVNRTATGSFSPIGVVEGTDQRVVTPDYISVIEKTKFGDQIDENLYQSLGFTLSIPIFNGLSSRIGLRRAKITYQNAVVTEQLARNSFNKIIYQAVTDLRAAESNYNSANSAYESSKDAFNAIQQRYSVGLVNSLDFNQAQTDLNQKEFSLIQARYNLIFRNKIIDFYLGNPLTF
ncbi:TolC family protein [Pararcticibacter amylolyticus]|uniref:TolC family protein n=2 Tax=Pararcticibacter amylolyticus TaxID=2173175 RepID=A0A2U2PAQ1_9SPHI|nr:TolC family protein [Pararcticibacter amylolyticus]